MSLTYAEFCAGYGGLGLAVEEVFGAELKWYSEFDAAPSKVMAHHWPGVPNHGDMTAIDWNAVEHVDILSGGTPCPDLSTAGRRKGMTEGTRSNLWVHMREAIAVIKPTYVVWENVRGAYSASADSDLEQCPGCVGDTGDGRVFLRALGRVLGDLSNLGYDCQWRGLRAADVGGCHARYRVFILATHPADASGQGLEVSGLGGIASRQDSGAATLRDIAHVANTECEPGRERRVSAPGQAQGGESSGVYSGRSGTRPTADTASARRTEGQDTRASRQDAGAGTRSSEPERGNGEPVQWGEYGPAIHRWERVLGRPAPRPTEPTGRNGGHRLSPRFTEWMMGLEDGWVTAPEIGLTRNEQLKACGNGVVPQQAIAALRDMLAYSQNLERAA